MPHTLPTFQRLICYLSYERRGERDGCSGSRVGARGRGARPNGDGDGRIS